MQLGFVYADTEIYRIYAKEIKNHFIFVWIVWSVLVVKYPVESRNGLDGDFYTFYRKNTYKDFLKKVLSNKDYRPFLKTKFYKYPINDLFLNFIKQDYLLVCLQQTSSCFQNFWKKETTTQNFKVFFISIKFNFV